MKIKLSIIFIFVTFHLFAQNATEVEILFNNKEFAKAKTVYELLLKRNPNDLLYNYRYARCCAELKDYDTAIKHFELAGTKYPLRDAYLGDLYFTTYNFERAITCYQTFIATLQANDVKIMEYELKINKAKLAANLLNRVEDIAIIDSVVVNKNDFVRFYKFSSELGKLKQERIKKNNKQAIDKILYTTERADRQCFSDSTSGNMDIFTSFKLLDDWSPASLLSNVINTSANENYPFLLLDGLTLYFASDGDNSIGGYDIFITKYAANSQDYLVPENIGMPFNSPANDYMMVIDEQQKMGWFATDRNQLSGKVVIYRFIRDIEKIIYRTDDSLKLRQLARLKSFRKAQISHDSYSAEMNVELINDDATIYLIINDSLIYTQVNQFQSTSALTSYKDWFSEWNELNKMKSELATLRLNYQITENEDDKIKLTNSILNLELQIIEKEKFVNQKLLVTRNEEIKFIEKK